MQVDTCTRDCDQLNDLTFTWYPDADLVVMGSSYAYSVISFSFTTQMHFCIGFLKTLDRPKGH